MNLKQYLDDTIGAALASLGAAESPAVVKQAQKPEFGHYQANGVMGAAKKLKMNPRQLAEKLVEQLTLKGVE
ncbi:MAG: arginyl-tRNA synthetase, partial [Patiriisocius sp.]